MNRILINSKDLLKAVESVGSIIKGNQIVPMCNNFLFEAKNDIFITADNLAVRSEVQLEYDDEVDIKACFDVAMSISILKNLPNEPVNLIFEEKQLIIKSSSGEYKLALFDPADFPRRVEHEQYKQANVNGHDLSDGLRNATKFVTKNDGMQITDGVCISFDDRCGIYSGSVWLTCYREIDGEGEPMNMVVTVEAARHIASVCEEVVTVQYNKKQLDIITGDHRVTVLPLEGSYPTAGLDKLNSEVSFDQDYGYGFDCEQLKQSMNRLCTISSNIMIDVMKLEFKSGQLKMIAENDFLSASSMESIPFSVPNDFVVAYNMSKLKWMLSVIPDDFKMYIHERTIPLADGSTRSVFVLFLYTEDYKLAMASTDIN